MEAITNNKNMLVATPARICPGFVSGCCNYQRAPGGAGTLTHRPGCPLGCRVTKVGGGFGWVLPPLRLQHPFSGGCTPAMLPRALGRAGASSKRCQTPGEGALRGGRRDGRAKSKAPKISKQGKTSNRPEKKKKKGWGELERSFPSQARAVLKSGKLGAPCVRVALRLACFSSSRFPEDSWRNTKFCLIQAFKGPGAWF